MPVFVALSAVLASRGATSSSRLDPITQSLVKTIRGDLVVTPAIVAWAERSPSGSPANRIRTPMPDGSRANLGDSRRPSGLDLDYARMGSFEGSPFGGMLDRYDYTSSSGASGEIFVDVYHPEHRERQAPSRLTSER